MGADWPFERFELGNGLKVVVAPDRALPLVAINLWIHVGSKDERPGRTGFAHLFEHMLFQGSEHVGTNDHFRLLQQIGGVANGSTWFDRTNYYETVPSNHLDLGLWLESDRLGFLLPAMTQEKLSNQQEVVLNERLQRVDNRPYGRAFEELQALLFPLPHPYHWPVIGTAEDIAAASLSEVREFFETWYRPNNAVLTLAGDLPADVAERVDAYFGEIPGAPIPERPAVELPELPAERRRRLEDRVNLSRVYLAWRIPPYGSPEWYAADLLAEVLSGGKSSPFYDDLVHRRRLAQDASAFTLPTEIASAFVVAATATPGVEIERLEEALLGHLRALVDAPPPAEEIDRARRRLATSHHGELETVERRADLLSQMTTLFDDPGRMATEIERTLRVEPEALVELVRRRLDPDRAVAVTVVPDARPESR